jgi:hypothetical protein
LGLFLDYLGCDLAHASTANTPQNSLFHEVADWGQVSDLTLTKVRVQDDWEHENHHLLDRRHDCCLDGHRHDPLLVDEGYYLQA